MADQGWRTQFDIYCERTDAGFWSEPLNALTNAAFVAAAFWMWRRCGGVRAARLLCGLLIVIGLGSFLFHTYATRWAALADVVPIGAFILVYLYLVHRDFLGLKPGWALAATAGFFPFAALVVAVLGRIPFMAISGAYWTVPILLFAYAFGLRHRLPQEARGLAAGGALLCLSIVVRSLDEGLCATWPVGTHFVWHVLNALMLAWMIEVYRRFRARA